jgi:hypothetical protein
MARVARHRGGGSRRRWPWTVAAVALASVSAAAARARARRRAEAAGEAGEVDRVGDRPDALAAARHKAAAVAAAAKRVGRRGVHAARHTPRVVGEAVTRLKDTTARRGPDRPGENQGATEAATSREPDTTPEATPAPTTDSPRSGEPGSA